MDFEAIKDSLREKTVLKTDEETLKTIYECAIDVVVEGLKQYHKQAKQE